MADKGKTSDFGRNCTVIVVTAFLAISIETSPGHGLVRQRVGEVVNEGVLDPHAKLFMRNALFA